MKYLANFITICRIIFAVVIGFIYFYHNQVTTIIIGLFFVAVISDFFDGYIARKYHAVTNSGKILDPIADKILAFAAYYIVYETGILPLPPILYVVVKEVGLTIFRMKKICSTGIYVPSFRLGKIKTAYNMFSFFVLLVVLLLENNAVLAEIPMIVYIMVWLTII